MSQRSHIASSGSTEMSACSAACSAPSRSPPTSSISSSGRDEPERAGGELPHGQVERDRVEATLLGQAAPLVGDDLVGHLHLAVGELDAAALLRRSSARTMLVSVSRRGWVYQGPSNGETSATRRRDRASRRGTSRRDAGRRRPRAPSRRRAPARASRAARRSPARRPRWRRPSPSAARRARRAIPRRARRARPACARARRPRRAPRPPQRTGAEHRVVRPVQRQLVRGRAQVPDADLGVRRIEDRRLVRARPRSASGWLMK